MSDLFSAKQTILQSHSKGFHDSDWPKVVVKTSKVGKTIASSLVHQRVGRTLQATPTVYC